jgi:acetyl-CoA carboxylase carboxyltransferase component
MGLGGPNLVTGATGQEVDAEGLGGATTHTTKSAVAHYRATDDKDCLERIRTYLDRLPVDPLRETHGTPPANAPAALYDVLPTDHRMAYDMHDVLACVLDDGVLDEFQPDIAREILCGHGRIEGQAVAVIANQRGLIKRDGETAPRIGGIIYTESAEKVSFFIETANREGLPLLFVQDVSGFMVGPEAEQSGIIRAGAHFVESMATAVVPKFVLTVNHASGAGYYAMAGQGFDPDFILSWPSGRMGVMEGESAVQAVFGDGSAGDGTDAARNQMRADYEHQLDARFAAARGYVDNIVPPEDTRLYLAFLLQVVKYNPGPHLGTFVVNGSSAHRTS